MSNCKSVLTAVGAAVALSVTLLAAPMAQAAPGADRVRIVVAYKAGASAIVRAAIAAAGGRVVTEIDELNAVAVLLPRDAVAALAAARGVDFVEEDAVVTIQGRPAARGARTQALPPGQTVPYGITLTQSDLVMGPTKWTPKVCIIDSGIDGTHEDLSGNTLAGQNYTTSGTWDSDEASHGTHVAGTIAALDNGIGVVGVNGKKQISLYIAKVFDASGSASNSVVAKAMLGCKRAGANVVSMSLGGPRNSRLQQIAADRLAASGALIVAAAGNDGTTGVSYPAGLTNVMSVAAVDANKAWASFSQYNPDVEIAGPGVHVLSTVPPGSQLGGSLVVGTTSYDVLGFDGSPKTAAAGPLADFGIGDTPVAGSMTGKVCVIQRGSIDFGLKAKNCQDSGGVGAVIYNNVPGELSGGTLGTTYVITIPVVGALQSDGPLLLAQAGQGAEVAVAFSDAKYAYYDGTSMATPHVSGVAALVWSYYPLCTAEQIRSTLKKSALDIDVAGFDDKTGFGLVQAKAAYDRIATLGCGN